MMNNCTNPPHFPPHCGCPAGRFEQAGKDIRAMQEQVRQVAVKLEALDLFDAYLSGQLCEARS